MPAIHFSDPLSLGGRQLHLQTQTLEKERLMVTTLFEGGRVLGKKTRSQPVQGDDSWIEKAVLEFHQTNKGALELIYGVSARVQTVRHPRSLVYLGQEFLSWGLLDEAISELELALDYNAHYTEAYLSLAEAYALRGGREEAFSILSTAHENIPRNAWISTALARLLIVEGDFDAAQRHLEEALTIHDDDPESHFLMAEACYRLSGRNGEGAASPQGYRKKCVEHLNRAVSLSERFRVRPLAEAVQAIHEDDRPRAEKLFEQVRKGLAPEVDLGFHRIFYLNFLYGEGSRNSESAKDYRRHLETLVQKHSDRSDLHNFLGVAYFVECRELFARALTAMRKAVELDPQSELARKHLKLAENDGKGLLLLLRALLK